jgi:hypothetical protein
MFGSLFRRAQATVDNAIGQIVNRAIVAIPFLVAAGFGTAAVAMRLNRELGPETGSLVLAAVFAVVGLLTALIVHSRAEKPAALGDEPGEAAAPESAAAVEEPGASDIDRELVMAALTSAAPIALPGLLRTIGRNLPLVAALAAAAFVIARDTGNASGHGALEPGE